MRQRQRVSGWNLIKAGPNTYTNADGDGYIMRLEATVHELCIINYAYRLITVPSGPYEITLIGV